MSEFQRNMLILAVIAVAAVMVSGVASGVGLLGALLNLAFTVVTIWFVISLYQRNSGTIALMPATPRLVLQGAGIALLLILITGLLRIPPQFGVLPSPFGWANTSPVLFWGSVFLCSFGIWWSWQQRTSKW